MGSSVVTGGGPREDDPGHDQHRQDAQQKP
jgi:hypothetical protein